MMSNQPPAVLAGLSPANTFANTFANTAALRAALENIFENASGPGYNLAYICDQALAALSAPPRNCDVYATYDEAFDAWDPVAHQDFDQWIYNPYRESEAAQ